MVFNITLLYTLLDCYWRNGQFKPFFLVVVTMSLILLIKTSSRDTFLSLIIHFLFDIMQANFWKNSQANLFRCKSRLFSYVENKFVFVFLHCSQLPGILKVLCVVSYAFSQSQCKYFTVTNQTRLVPYQKSEQQQHI